MDFNSLTQGATLYVISTNGGLSVAPTTVKGKSAPYWPMPANGMNSQLIDITVTFNGQDRVIPGLPVGLEVAGRDPEVYVASRDMAERIIDDKVSEAEKILQNVPYYERLKTEGPRCKEIINPGYAQTRRQTETIAQLQERAANTESELQAVRTQNAEILQLLKEMRGEASPAPTGTGRGKKDS